MRAAACDDGRGSTAHRSEVLAAAVNKIQGGCLRAACQLLRGDQRVPGTWTTFSQLHELTACPVEDEERQALYTQVRRARALRTIVPLIKMRTVRRKLRALKRAAEPGPSGWRNSMIMLVGERPQGCEVLTRWCRAYARGELGPIESVLWSSVCLIPIAKEPGN